MKITESDDKVPLAVWKWPREQNIHAEFSVTLASGTCTASRVGGSAFRRKYLLLRGALAACKSIANIVVNKFVRSLLTINKYLLGCVLDLESLVRCMATVEHACARALAHVGVAYSTHTRAARACYRTPISTPNDNFGYARNIWLQRLSRAHLACTPPTLTTCH